MGNCRSNIHNTKGNFKSELIAIGQLYLHLDLLLAWPYALTTVAKLQ